MNRREIESALLAHPDTRGIFESVCARDTLPSRARKARPVAYICNTAKAKENGRHWVCFFFNKRAPPEFFDSYGGKPKYKSFKRLLGPSYKWNRRQIQHQVTTVCGQHCMNYVLQRSKNRTMEEILNNFSSKNLMGNDWEVNRTVQRNFHVRKDLVDADFFIQNLIAEILSAREHDENHATSA